MSLIGSISSITPFRHRKIKDPVQLASWVQNWLFARIWQTWERIFQKWQYHEHWNMGPCLTDVKGPIYLGFLPYLPKNFWKGGFSKMKEKWTYWKIGPSPTNVRGPILPFWQIWAEITEHFCFQFQVLIWNKIETRLRQLFYYIYT